MNNMICIEGIDCSGKTSVGRLLSQKLNYRFIEKPMLEFFDISRSEYKKVKATMRKRVANVFEEKAAQDIFFWYQGFNNVIASNYRKQEDVIVDRHQITNSFWNCNSAKGIPDSYIELLKAFYAHFGKPSLTVILTVAKETALQRLETRCMEKHGTQNCESYITDYKKEERKIVRADDFLPFAENLCKLLDLEYLVIDTENTSIESEVDQIVEYFREKCIS